MYLSKLVLDPRSHQVQAELANRYELHRTLAGAFAGQNYAADRLLYRLEINHTPPYLVLLLQSSALPDWSALEQKDYLLGPAQVKPYAPQIRTGESFAFRLMANPTRRLRVGEDAGKRVALYRLEDQQNWILRKAEQHGFRLTTLQIANLSDEYSYKVIGKERKRLTHHGVRFEGVLEVVDPQRFGLTLAHGIGSAKGFGFGLLSIARL
jgi:CRISPR system Cascade subunit CasE